jgi:hypothetical protein
MKITKKGTPAGERKWVGSCYSCNSEAEAKQSEMTHITSCQREGSFSWEVCPVCGAGDKATGYNGMLFYPKSGER